MLGTYEERNLMRVTKLNQSTLALIAYFMGLGDDQLTAETKATDLSTEVAAYLYAYTLGNMALLAQIDASALPYMDAAAKAFLINALTLEE